MAKKSSLQSALNYLEAKRFEKSLNWSKTTTMAYFFDLEDENNNGKANKTHSRKAKVPLYKWIVLAVFIALFLVGVWLTMNNFFLY